MADQITLQELSEFVTARVADDVRRAEEAGDKAALSWYEGTRVVVDQVRRDVEERPFARDEVGRYLMRSARLYRDHPDFRLWWD
ncbi:hypothetical protein ACFP3Q_14070 [Nocardioides sp. GCM10027113]|uniref:hypothetical protein n=1 Tax=unclassified Nocardioides TaxID=2615069 RepID=UPI00360882FF